MAELCLGTAQLGMKYGINNKVGKLDKDAVFDILNLAISGGINVLDTASIYGEAEELIGEYFERNSKTKSKVRIVTKQCAEIKGLDNKQIECSIRNELESSLKRLRMDVVDGYLLHLYREVDNTNTLHILKKLKEEGMVRKIGVSVYDVDEAIMAIESGDIDYLQMPCSIFDQRGVNTGVFNRAKKCGITVFTRSAFLQGLLMMNEDDVPIKLNEIKPYIRELDMLTQKYCISRKHIALKYVLEQADIDYMVFGVEKKEQLLEILEEKNSRTLSEPLQKEIKDLFSQIPTDLILPINW